MSFYCRGLFRHWFSCALLIFASLVLSPAQASEPVIRVPNAVINDVQEQTGVPESSFALPIQLVNQSGANEGSIRFTVVSASHDDLNGLSFPVSQFKSTAAEEVLRFRPSLVKEGMYRLRADVESKLFKSSIYFWVLWSEGRVYYSSDTGNIVSGIAAYNLKSHPTYQQLTSKAKAAQVARKSSGDTTATQPFLNDFLSPEDLKARERIFQEEVDAIQSRIPTVANTQKKLAKAVTVTKGQVVTVTVRWPVDAGYTQFLPLEGAKIHIANLDNVTNPEDATSGRIATGVLNSNGQFSFTSPVDNLRFRVWLAGENAGYVVQVANYATMLYEPLRAKVDQETTIDLVPAVTPTPASSEYAQGWSIFQAVYDLNKNVSTFTGGASAPALRYVNTNLNLSGGANFDANVMAINLDSAKAFTWDSIAHEYSHAFSYAHNAIVSEGGGHQYGNQYDFPDNSSTLMKKRAANRLAFGEGFATWFAINYWKNNAYVGKVPQLGDTLYQNVPPGTPAIFGDIEDHGPIGSIANVYGEDSEAAVMRFLWDLTDPGEETYTRISCSKYCKEDISMSFSTLIQRAFLNRSLDGLSGLYQRLIPLHTGASNVSALETVGNVAPASVEKLFQLGALSAEHGFGAFLSQSNNANPFRDLDDATKRNLDTDPVTLNWSQLKTGSMPGLDQFELLFYSESLDKLYYKMNVGALAPADKNYQYKMPRNEVQMLVNALQRSGYLAKDKLVLIVKGLASGSGAGGAVSSGPYYGNAEIFSLKLGSKKYATIAVDSSGSNLETDKGNLRIQAAHDMLKSMGARNAEVISGAQTGKLLSVAALEFDSSPSVLSDFFDPEKLAGLEIFKSVDSEGGTDIAAAIRRSTSLLKAFQPPANPPVVDVNRPHMYMLTDMNNNEGPAVVNTAVNEAKAQNIEVHFGHLKPLEVKSSAVSGMINGDPVRLAKVAEPLDSLISAILATGGTYSVIENAGAQKAWVKLMDELSVMDPYTRTSVNLPLDVQVYGFARNVGNPEPVYVFTAPTTGEVTITFDGKGSFVPNLNVGSTSGQTPLGRDLYSLPFKVTAGQTYQININEPVAAAGVYSIVLRQTATGGPVVTPPTMTLNPIADVTEGTAPVISGTTTNVADGTPVTITFTTSKATVAKATLVVNSTVSGNAFSASGPTTLPQGTTTVTVDIAGLGIAPITQAFTVTPKVQPPVTQAATAVPVDNPFALIALAVVIAGFAGYRHRKQQR